MGFSYCLIYSPINFHLKQASVHPWKQHAIYNTFMYTCTIDPVLFTDLFFFFLPVFRTRPGTPPCPPTPSGGTLGSTPTTQQVHRLYEYCMFMSREKLKTTLVSMSYPLSRVPAGRLDVLTLSRWRKGSEQKTFTDINPPTRENLGLPPS
jgi:hypothetical protein